ncbi:MAG: hypothetical protein IJF21_07890 [Clostridia bacterium]|nr:hypothetical protein [Clostridia bacterium]
MTVAKLLEHINATRSNEISDDVKTGWIRSLEGRVLCEIHKKDPEKITLPEGEDDELTIPEPYCEAYVLYLAAMIEFSAGNYLSYGEISREFENSLARYARHVIRMRK